MARKSKRKSNQVIEKIASVMSLFILIAAWWFGGIQISDRQFTMLESLIEENQQLVKIEENLFQIIEGEEIKSWLGIGTGIGYGGELNIALKLDNKGTVQQASILSIKDTSSYVNKVIENGLVNKILGETSRKQIQADGISGATLSSNGILQGVNEAAEPVRQQLFNYQLKEQTSPLDTVGFLDLLAVVMFFLAVFISRSGSIHKVKIQWTLMIASLGIFGFYSASLISSSTMGILISGSWRSGLGNYTAFVLLVLSLGYILLFNKNLYCQMLCPMGITQQCLSKLTNSKTISLKHKAFQWFPRFLLLATLACGLYFRNPSAFSYEPFGIMFGMVGSLYLFILTLLVLITSLLVHRPWCKTLCPITAMTDYIVFLKDWYKQATKPNKKKKRMATGNKQPAAAQSISVKIEEA
ncbi:FMN-binding protein [Photobacterium sp. SDRW27]|uniref:FMN-binding protein n=1 Tax=Photobacterium obscurum TaxID=2829490 RepID=UPI002243A8F7|nr:FMN-binding protein [Photobacterium obscurum]MCW8329109.1 FMN-binding protein [Photobacterium obscurum]